MEKYKYRLVVKKDTASSWRASDYIPLEGEPCYDTDTKLLKIGDGVNTFADLNLSINKPVIDQTILVVSELPTAEVINFSKIVKVIGAGIFLCSSNIENPIINSDVFWVEI